MLDLKSGATTVSGTVSVAETVPDTVLPDALYESEMLIEWP